MRTLPRTLALALLLGSALTLPPAAYADKPDKASQGKPGKSAHDGPRRDFRDDDGRRQYRPDDRGDHRGYDSRRQDARREHSRRQYFDDGHRVAIRGYFEDSYRSGHCPPGLAKKRNGCLPPGQAKKWAYGRPLPRDVVFYDLPPDLVIRLGVPPAGHRFVRVAADILLIAIGTGIVIDAIEDLSR